MFRVGGAVYTSTHLTMMFGGIASDISAYIMENAFEFLDAPVQRVGSLDTPIPFASSLEQQYLANRNFETALKALLNY